MNFIQSIKICFRKYANFKGRARRSEFWWFQLFAIIVSYGAMLLDHLLLGYTFNNTVTPLALIATAVLTIPTAAVTARRLHDIGWSGWVQLPVFAVYSAYLEIWFPGFSLSTVGITLMIMGLLYWVGLSLIFIKDSKPGANKYGLNPKSPNMGEIFN